MVWCKKCCQHRGVQHKALTRISPSSINCLVSVLCPSPKRWKPVVWLFSIVHSIHKLRSWRVVILYAQHGSTVTGEKQSNNQNPRGNHLIFPAFSHGFLTLGSAEGKLWFMPSVIRQCRGEVRRGHSSSLLQCSEIPWARWNQSISNGRGHESDIVRGKRA